VEIQDALAEKLEKQIRQAEEEQQRALDELEATSRKVAAARAKSSRLRKQRELVARRQEEGVRRAWRDLEEAEQQDRDAGVIDGEDIAAHGDAQPVLPGEEVALGAFSPEFLREFGIEGTSASLQG
jgi:hypothetical protein